MTLRELRLIPVVLTFFAVGFVGCGKPESPSAMDSGSGDADTDGDTDSDADTDTEEGEECHSGVGGTMLGSCDPIDTHFVLDDTIVESHPFSLYADLGFCDASVDVSCEFYVPGGAPFVFVVSGQDGHQAVEQSLLATGFSDAGLPDVDYTSQRLIGYGDSACCACGYKDDESESHVYQLVDGGVHVVHYPMFSTQGMSNIEGQIVDFTGVIVVDSNKTPTVCMHQTVFLRP